MNVSSNDLYLIIGELTVKLKIVEQQLQEVIKKYNDLLEKKEENGRLELSSN